MATNGEECALGERRNEWDECVMSNKYMSNQRGHSYSMKLAVPGEGREQRASLEIYCCAGLHGTEISLESSLWLLQAFERGGN